MVPLPKQRFREMFRQAQHDRRKCVIPSVVEESRGNEFFLIHRDKGLLLFNFSSARIRLVPLFKHDSARCFDKLNITENFLVLLR